MKLVLGKQHYFNSRIRREYMNRLCLRRNTYSILTLPL